MFVGEMYQIDHVFVLLDVCSQEEFPNLTSVSYPSWVSAVIFLIAGVPSLAVPIYALGRLVFVCCRKRNSSGVTEGV